MSNLDYQANSGVINSNPLTGKSIIRLNSALQKSHNQVPFLNAPANMGSTTPLNIIANLYQDSSNNILIQKIFLEYDMTPSVAGVSAAFDFVLPNLQDVDLLVNGVSMNHRLDMDTIRNNLFDKYLSLGPKKFFIEYYGSFYQPVDTATTVDNDVSFFKGGCTMNSGQTYHIRTDLALLFGDLVTPQLVKNVRKLELSSRLNNSVLETSKWVTWPSATGIGAFCSLANFKLTFEYVKYDSLPYSISSTTELIKLYRRASNAQPYVANTKFNMTLSENTFGSYKNLQRIILFFERTALSTTNSSNNRSTDPYFCPLTLLTSLSLTIGSQTYSNFLSSESVQLENLAFYEFQHADYDTFDLVKNKRVLDTAGNAVVQYIPAQTVPYLSIFLTDDIRQKLTSDTSIVSGRAVGTNSTSPTIQISYTTSSYAGPGSEYSLVFMGEINRLVTYDFNRECWTIEY